MADLLRGDLVDSGAEVIVGTLGPLRLRRAQERGVRRRVRPRIGILQFEVADDGELIHHRSQRLQCRRQLDEAAISCRRPARQVASHRHVDEAEATDRIGRGLGDGGQRRNHGVEQWQRDAGAQTSQERPPRQCQLGDDHRDILI
jgi:hypothetical protein